MNGTENQTSPAAPAPVADKPKRKKSTIPVFGGRTIERAQKTSVLYTVAFPVRTPYADLSKHLNAAIKAAKDAGVPTPDYVEGRLELLAKDTI